MQIRYYKEYSRFLNRFMEFKVYGHAGRPIVIFPCQSGRFFDWEDRNMCNAVAPWAVSYTHLKHRSGGCGTASALPKCSIIDVYKRQEPRRHRRRCRP